MSTASGFILLPGEVRTEIYRYLFRDAEVVAFLEAMGKTCAERRYDPKILLVNKQIYQEVIPVLGASLHLSSVGRSDIALLPASRRTYCPHIQKLSINYWQSIIGAIDAMPALRYLTIIGNNYISRVQVGSKEDWDNFTAGTDENFREHINRSCEHLRSLSYKVAQIQDDPKRTFKIQAKLELWPRGAFPVVGQEFRSLDIIYDVDTHGIVNKTGALHRRK